jgi:hexosaminidase
VKKPNSPPRLLLAGLTVAATAATMVAVAPGFASANPDRHGGASRILSVVPAPVSVRPEPRDSFEITKHTKIIASGAAAEVGRYLAGALRPATGFALPVTSFGSDHNAISLRLGGADRRVGDAGYDLRVEDHGVSLRANTSDGLFAGVQTLRQLLPANVESKTRQSGPWIVSGGRIVDFPRFAHRGTMLDVARHFFTVDQVKRYIDEAALYKINVFHLHLADDQGWRIEIKSWPRLATFGGSTQVGGGPGGFYTQDQYRDIVAYAASRHMTIIPEIDMPGHTNAALASYADLNCDGVAPPLYTGTDVGFSSLCVGKEITYKFLDDVIGELAALTPGRYLHLGTDEAHATKPQDYLTFVNRVIPIVTRHGKLVTGWHQFTKANPPVSAVPQFWDTDAEDADTAAAAARGNKIVMSPANKAYMDMKYTDQTPIGQDWAGLIEVADAYNWDPGNFLKNVPESAIRGLEAPVWTETIVTSADIEFMAFPRLAAYAELGWSPFSTHNFDAFKQRLAKLGPRWTAAGVNFYRSPQVPWPS